jgi:hypothetical protein
MLATSVHPLADQRQPGITATGGQVDVTKTPAMSDDKWNDTWDIEGDWFSEQVAANIGEIHDENLEAIFRMKVEAWAGEHWIPAEDTAHRVGTEARAFVSSGKHAAAVVWAATCAEIIFRDLTLRPIFVGLFLGQEWPDAAVKFLIGRRWLAYETRQIARNALDTVARVKVEEMTWKTYNVWDEIRPLVELRNAIVHEGAQAGADNAQHGVDVVAGLYARLLPVMRELCGMNARFDYVPPESRLP